MVVNLGFGKTGTCSLARALEILGYKVAHFEWNGKLLNDWVSENWKNGKKAFDGINADAFVDFQAHRKNWKRTVADYPRAKFVLTSRDENEWLKSWMFYCAKHYDVKKLKPAEMLDWYRAVYDDIRGYFMCREYMSLLDIDIERGDGWAALCEYLDKPVPDAEFPYLNKGEYRDA